MLKSAIEKNLICALEYLDEKGADGMEDNQAASFAASIISMGVLPTVVVYEEKNANLNRAILAILQSVNGTRKDEYRSLLVYVREKRVINAYTLKESLLLAATALKLALRTYKPVEEEEQKKEAQP